MDNKEIYKKTIGFSVRRLLWDILAFLAFTALTALGFVILDKTSNAGLIGLAIGALVGGIVSYILLRYVSYTYKAGQIAMMTEAITKDKLPDDVIGAGKKIVKERFTTITAYFAVTGVIKGIFRQLGRGLTAIGKAVGGDAGSTVGSTVSAVIDTIVAYLCDCCLGWVFYRSDIKATKATCEGAVLFFRHGKTLLKNLGRVFGMSLVSFLVIGGIFFGISYLIMSCFPDAFRGLSNAIVNTGSNVPAWVSDINTLTIVSAAISGVVFWSILHSAFIRPFILVGVLRNYINSGKNDIPSEKAFDELDSKSKKFAELHSKLDA
ncbi:hypothetical protein IKG73_03570 [Candidatus Saccharibacteria bacterium]|nr:hypothetical protein [Candidatus Saccharibacteria bacterium]